MKRMVLNFAVILLITLASSCNDMIDADKNINRRDITKESSNLEGYFPNSPGCNWKFNVLNLSSGFSDEVTINITGEELLPNGYTASVWEYKFKDSTERNFVKYVKIINNTIIEWDLNHLYRTMLSYVVPFEVGKGWITSQTAVVFNTVEMVFVGEDTCRTLSEMNNNNIIGSNTHSFKIMRQCWTPFNRDNTYANEEIEFVPYIGIISILLKDKTFLQTYKNDMPIEKWTLIGYHIN